MDGIVRPLPLTSFAPVLGDRPLGLPDPEVSWCDGANRWHNGLLDRNGQGPSVGPDAWLRLIRYRGGDKGPVLLAPGFGMSATAYVSDTTEKNITEFLCENSYDVWLFDYRAGIELPSARTDFTFDDVATEDWPCAVARVREVSGAESVQVIGHCMGSMGFQMAMLAGLEGVRSAVCSQSMAYVVPAPLVRLKNIFNVGSILAALGIRLLAPETHTLAGRALDLVLRAVPMASEERCEQPLCRWINAIYGLTHRHAQLNEATHKALEVMFGVGNLRALRHVARIMQNGRLVDHRGRNVYMRHPQRMAVPMLLLQGTHNYIFRPKGSERTLRWLSASNGPHLYQRLEIDGYAHLDSFIGQNAHVDVFPQVMEHLDRYVPAS